jgi:hypothetical protein
MFFFCCGVCGLRMPWREGIQVKKKQGQSHQQRKKQQQCMVGEGGTQQVQSSGKSSDAGK